MSGAALLAHLRGLGLREVVPLAAATVYVVGVGVRNLVDDYRDARAERGRRCLLNAEENS